MEKEKDRKRNERSLAQAIQYCKVLPAILPEDNDDDDRELNEEIIAKDLTDLNLLVKPLNKLVPPAELFYLVYNKHQILIYDLVSMAIAKGVS